MGPTGLVYDPIYLLHDTGEHIEVPERLTVIMQTLEEFDLKTKLLKIKPEKATLEDLQMYHSLDYVEKIRCLAQKGGGQLDYDTVMGPNSYETALWAVGGANKAVQAVMNGDVKNAISLLRPPGHHAEKDRAMGFCLFNNCVVAVKKAKRQFNLKKVLILDWDAHHGNGIQNAFYDDPEVLYISIHQDGIFPQTGWANEVGKGLGEGFNINIPVSRWTGDAGYYYLFTKLVLPIIDQYQPELIVINAGFDAHFADESSGLEVTTAGFQRMTEMVMEVADNLCQGRVVALLEGGYALGTLGFSLAAMVSTMMGQAVKITDPVPTPPSTVRPQVRIRIDDAIKVQQKFWKIG